MQLVTYLEVLLFVILLHFSTSFINLNSVLEGLSYCHYIIYFSISNAANPKGSKTLLGSGISIYYVNGKPVLMNGPRKLRNPIFDCFFLKVPFNKISLFSKDLIYFTLYFMSLFVSNIHEPVSLSNLSGMSF